MSGIWRCCRQQVLTQSPDVDFPALSAGAVDNTHGETVGITKIEEIIPGSDKTDDGSVILAWTVIAVGSEQPALLIGLADTAISEMAGGLVSAPLSSPAG